MKWKATTPGLITALALVTAAVAVPEAAIGAPTKDWGAGHYCRANLANRELIDDWSIAPCKNVPEFRGFVVDVYWKDVEPRQGAFDFSGMQRNIQIAKQYKKLIIFRFSDIAKGGQANLPSWMVSPKYGGGFYKDSSGATYPTSWDPDYQAAWDNYLRRAGAWLNGQPAVAAAILIESSRRPPANNKNWAPDGASSQVRFFERQNKALADAAPRKPSIQYLNYLPSIPQTVKSRLPNYIASLKNGFGDPDLRNELHNKYLLRDSGFRQVYTTYKNKVPFAAEVQRNGFAGGSAKTTFDYGVKQVGLHFFIWATGQRTKRSKGFTIYDVINVLQTERKKGNPLVNPKVPYSSYRIM